VAIFYGTGAGSGFSGAGDQLWTQDSGGIADNAQANERFGSSIVAGYFNDDLFCDLAIGVPNQRVSGRARAGAVHVLYGSANGLVTAGSQFFHQDVNGIADAAEANDFFGASLIAADYDGDGRDDLIVGVPGEDADGQEDSGAIHVIRSSAAGLRTSGGQFFTQNTIGVDASEEGDSFGTGLIASDFDADGFNDLAIGVPGRDVSGFNGAGAIVVLRGSNQGLRSNGARLWAQDTNGIAGSCEPGEAFGSAFDQ